jgi:hypothetical protein
LVIKSVLEVKLLVEQGGLVSFVKRGLRGGGEMMRLLKKET